jgi:rSAM/selenodomain-associated transferase 1
MLDADDRTLAIMIKAPHAGHVKTRLARAYSPDAVVSLYRALVEDTIDLARAARVRTVAVCPAADADAVAHWLSPDVDVLPQRGVGLAAGLYSAFEELCGSSGTRVIAFNADSPHLPAAVLESAFAALIADDLVVGPCDDGGYYLVGAKRPHAGLFDASAMGKDSACEALLAQAARLKLSVAIAAEHYDIDVPGDVVRLASDIGDEPRRAFRTVAALKAMGLANRS